MLVDTHCHLDQIEDLEKALEEAARRGVGRIVAVTEDPPSLERARTIRDRHPEKVLLGAGLHPVPLLAMSPDEERAALDLVRESLPGAAVVGEIGLDFKHATTDEEKARQLACLHAQLRLAAGARLPVNLHSRRSERAVMNEAIAFRKETGLGAQLHWFTGSKKLVRITNEHGIHVSAGPSVLQDDRALEVACLVREDLLLLETDGPVPFQGVPARPDQVRDVCDAIARARGVSPGDLETRTTENFHRYLGSPSGHGDG